MIGRYRRFWRSAAAFVVVSVGCALIVPESQPARAATPSIDDVRSLLANRSPGARGAGALYQTKLGLNDWSNPGPKERVLDGVRDHPGGPAGGGTVPGVGEPIPDGNGPAGGPDDGSPAGSTTGSGPSFADIGGIGPGGFGGVSSGGSTAGPTPTPTPTPTTPAVTAVPEPATWLSMLVGFAAIALVMRRRPRPVVAFA